MFSRILEEIDARDKKIQAVKAQLPYLEMLIADLACTDPKQAVVTGVVRPILQERILKLALSSGKMEKKHAGIADRAQMVMLPTCFITDSPDAPKPLTVESHLERFLKGNF